MLFAMDPRGRARIPLDLFREAAERHGYIIVSSYNTASDTASDPNTPAMQAMLADTPQLFFADGRRVYLAGFSGTARVGWYFATQLGDRTAGLIGFGGGLPTRFELPETLPFVFFGSAGSTDFNYAEMLALDSELALRGAVHRFVSFDGVHEWGNAETCGLALDWMELQAMRSGRRDTDPGLVEELYQGRLSTAMDFEETGDLFGAFLHYGAMAEDFDGPRDLLRRGEPHRVLLLLGVADAIKPDDFNALVSYARAFALAGDGKKAIEVLQRADKIVTLQASWLEEDPYLQALADEPELQALLRHR